MRKLASIATIATAEPIPEADRLDVVTLEGKAWRIVTGRNEFRPGDRAVYFEIDSALPADDERFAFLHDRCLRTWSDKHDNALKQADRTSREENISPLKGLLKCGHCGGPLMHYTKRKKGAVYSYYRCLRDSKRAESVCPIKEIAAPVVEKLVCEWLSAIFRSPQVLAALSERTGVECAALLPAFDGDFWQEATSAERRRMIELLVAEAVLYGDRLELELQCEGIKSIMEEIENESSQN